VEKKEELDATAVSAATAPVPVFDAKYTSNTELMPFSVDTVSCEPASQFLSSSFSCRHDASLDADGFCQEMSPTTDALDLVYYHGLARNSSSLRQ